MKKKEQKDSDEQSAISNLKKERILKQVAQAVIRLSER